MKMETQKIEISGAFGNKFRIVAETETGLVEFYRNDELLKRTTVSDIIELLEAE